MKGAISITRTSGGDERRCIRLTVIDELSHVRFLEVTLTPEAFALALTGLGEQEVEFDLRPTLVGKLREHKTELVLSPSGEFDPATREAQAKQALAPFEVDGWKGHANDLFNGHRRRGEFHEVSFVRYVDPE